MKISNQLYFLLQYKNILILHTIDTINYSVHKQKKEKPYFAICGSSDVNQKRQKHLRSLQ